MEREKVLEGLKVGFAVTGSFCTIKKALTAMEDLAEKGCDIYPILSNSVNEFDTRFSTSKDFKNRVMEITKKECITSIVEAEPIGPKGYLDVLVVLPCTGNSLSKIANGITDTPVTMACKAHLRNNKPVIISISTNDGLGASAKNLGMLLNTKNIYFVPFGQDDPKKKTNSLVAKTELLSETIIEALKSRQLEPILITDR